MTKYRYEHPGEVGFGQHHAVGPLDVRSAQPDEVAASMRAAIEVINPTDEQRAELETFLGRTMHDLDMHHGTEVELEDAPDADTGLKVVTWTDAHGNERRTSVTEEQFSEFFKPVEAAA